MVVQFTGVSQAEGAAVAQAEYRYRWVPTADAQKLGITRDGTSRTGSATLQRFDDGWRLQSVGALDVADPRLSLAVPPLSPPATVPPSNHESSLGSILGTWRAG